MLPKLVPARQCDEIFAIYAETPVFRNHILKAWHRFERGEHHYFAHPLPEIGRSLSRRPCRVPSALPRSRPTPLLPQYGPGDYNRLHQDLYGAHVFPLQVAILLSEPDVLFEGDEFILTEQRPRMQSHAAVVPLTRGNALVFAVTNRPHRGTKGDYRVMMRHGVSEVRSGRRHTLDIIFYDAV